MGKENTVYYIDGLLKSVDTVKLSSDIIENISEFSTGFLFNSKNAVCLGFSVIEPQIRDDEQSNILKECVVSRGYYKPDNSNNFTVYSENMGSYIEYDEFPLKINDLLGSQVIYNSYAFGSIFFNFDTQEIEQTLIRGGTGGSELPILVYADVDEEIALSWLKFNTITEYNNIDTNNKKELLRFVLYIQQYYGKIDKRNIVKVIYEDKRKLCGRTKLSERTICVDVVPSLLRHLNDNSVAMNNLDTLVYNIVSQWIQLDWLPDFTTYWTNHSEIMSNRVKYYLLDNFGINIL